MVDKMEKEKENSYFFLPSNLLNENDDDMMHDDIPSVQSGKYFSFPPTRSFKHPPDGIISSRILPDESNLIRFTSNLSADFEIPSTPDFSGVCRMMTKAYQEEYSAEQEKPVVLHHGEILLHFP